MPKQNPNSSLKKAKPAAMKRLCPKTWDERHIGDCLAETQVFGNGTGLAYVHPGGWLIDPKCSSDKRFTQEEFMAALSAALKKMNPNAPLSSGGCLGHYNPEWGRRLMKAVWERHMIVTCPEYEPKDNACAREGAIDMNFMDSGGNYRRIEDYYRRIEIKNIQGCMGKDATGLAGVLFHETLHAAGADNFGVTKHNQAGNLEQVEFVRDIVYGAEALCFLGQNPSRKKQVNLLQCKNVVGFDDSNGNVSLCDGFSTYFTDAPAWGLTKD